MSGPAFNQSSGSRSDSPLMAVDIGNSYAKLGLFPAALLTAIEPKGLPLPTATIDFLTGDGPSDALLEKLPAEKLRWRVSSVNRAGQQRLSQWVRHHRPADEFELLSVRDLPLKVQVDEPTKVGLDRLAAAVGANVLRPENAPALVVGAGTAITVNLLSNQGVFLGGAILPGFRISAEALFAAADQLPLARMQSTDRAPDVVGKNTEDAIHSGLFWGAVGSVREIIARIKAEMDSEPAIYITGGDLRRLSGFVADHAQYLPHLVLSGIAVASRHS